MCGLLCEPDEVLFLGHNVDGERLWVILRTEEMKDKWRVVTILTKMSPASLPYLPPS